jgi:hypothetical protein
MRRVQRNQSHAAHRDAKWVTEANAWAKSMTNEYFQYHRTGLHTAADVLLWLDGREDQPPGWVRWMGSQDYATRYQMVRHACQALCRNGYLETSSTQNAKGRDAVAYHYTGHSDAWAIQVLPADQSERVSGLVRGWLYTHRDQLAGVGAITITLRKQQASNDSEGGGAKDGRSDVRSRAG